MYVIVFRALRLVLYVALNIVFKTYFCTYENIAQLRAIMRSIRHRHRRVDINLSNGVPMYASRHSVDFNDAQIDEKMLEPIVWPCNCAANCPTEKGAPGQRGHSSLCSLVLQSLKKHRIKHVLGAGRRECRRPQWHKCQLVLFYHHCWRLATVRHCSVRERSNQNGG